MDFVRPKRPSVGIDMAPLIDCVFLLLIFFMLSSSFLQPVMQLTLPEASTRDEHDPARLVVSVDHAGVMFLDGAPVTIEALGAELRARIERDGPKPVSFRGDRDMRYHLFVEVMDLARRIGYRDLNIVHRGVHADAP